MAPIYRSHAFPASRLRGDGYRLGTSPLRPHIHAIANSMEDANMQAMEIQEHARKLRDARGELAIAHAAQKARDFEHQGDTKQAETWRRIEAALRQMQGPRVS
jgi:hypothetical protein